MEITIEVIFAVVTAVITALLGTLFKDGLVPARFIPLQNFIIGTVACIFSIGLGLIDDIYLALIISYGMSMGVGGTYDFIKTKKKG